MHNEVVVLVFNSHVPSGGNVYVADIGKGRDILRQLHRAVKRHLVSNQAVVEAILVELTLVPQVKFS